MKVFSIVGSVFFWMGSFIQNCFFYLLSDDFRKTGVKRARIILALFSKIAKATKTVSDDQFIKLLRGIVDAFDEIIGENDSVKNSFAQDVTNDAKFLNEFSASVSQKEGLKSQFKTHW